MFVFGTNDVSLEVVFTSILYKFFVIVVKVFYQFMLVIAFSCCTLGFFFVSVKI